MDKIKVTFPDGNEQEYNAGITAMDILQQMGGRLRKESVAVNYNGDYLDLTRPLTEDGALVFVPYTTSEGMDIFWHSAAHVMAHAIKNLFPEAKFAFGPPVENGFYYDVDLDKSLSTEDLSAIESEMQNIVKADHRFERLSLSQQEAVKLFKQKNETFKVEQIERLGEPPSVYKEDDFYDLCRGPHVPSTKYIKYFKLLNIAGAYWLGDEKNPQLQRVYGVAFPKKSQLETHLEKLEQAKLRDHRKLGKELDLFSINEEVGPGLVLWHPKGAFIRHQIETFWKEQHLSGGYAFVQTPHIAKSDLWSTSGHLDFFSENMFSPMNVDEMQYLVKPMNCPYHLHIYKNDTKSYRDLPIRWAELGTVYRYERSGVLHGLMRVRGFTQDDAHIFCRPDQLDAEVVRVIKFSISMLEAFGFRDYDVFVSTRPENYVGTLESWQIATKALKAGLEKSDIDYAIDPGEGVFYGPKIDIKIRDSIGRSWQCSTIQVDFNEPERFDLTYVGQDGDKHRPIMIHRALLGSLERFFGVLIEHYAGAFPLWLTPVQVAVLPLTETEHEYALQIHEKLLAHAIRSEFDDRSEKIGYKIREASTFKIPYMFIIGPKEVEAKTLSVRRHKQGDLGTFQFADILNRLQNEITEKQ